MMWYSYMSVRESTVTVIAHQIGGEMVVNSSIIQRAPTIPFAMLVSQLLILVNLLV